MIKQPKYVLNTIYRYFSNAMLLISNYENGETIMYSFFDITRIHTKTYFYYLQSYIGDIFSTTLFI